jgi:hypothetical protein
VTRWVMIEHVEFLDEKDRVYVRAILVPSGVGGMSQSELRRPSPREVHLDRELRRMARALQRNLKATIDRVESQGSWCACRILIHEQIRKTRPRIRRLRPGFWGRQELLSFLHEHNATVRLLQMSAAAGRVKVPSSSDLKNVDVYWEVPDLDPEAPRQKGSKA